jgi:hypothetical protein
MITKAKLILWIGGCNTSKKSSENLAHKPSDNIISYPIEQHQKHLWLML